MELATAWNWTIVCNNLSLYEHVDQFYNRSASKFCPRDSPPPIGMDTYVRISAYVLIFVVCIVGNTLVVVTLLQNRKMRTVTNIFLINLSVGDLLLGVFCMPFTLTGQILMSFIFGAVMCKIVPYFQVVAVAVSTFTLVSISIERLFAICWPLTSRRWQTVSHSIKMTIICWILAFIVAFPVMWYSQFKMYLEEEGVKYYMCREMFPSDEGKKVYNIFLLIVLFGLPGVFMTLAYMQITKTLYKGMRGEAKSISASRAHDGLSLASVAITDGKFSKFTAKFSRIRANSADTNINSRNGSVTTGIIPHSATADDLDALDTPMVTSPAQTNPQTPSPTHGVRSTHSERNLAAKKRVILMLVIVVFEFFVCFTPLWIVNVVVLFNRPPQGMDLSPSMWALNASIPYLQLLMYVSTCCNPITYCFLHSKFRQGFIQAFKCARNRQDISDLLRTKTSRPVSYRRNESYSTGTTGLSNKNVTQSEFDIFDLCESNPNLLGPATFRNRSASAW